MVSVVLTIIVNDHLIRGQQDILFCQFVFFFLFCQSFWNLSGKKIDSVSVTLRAVGGNLLKGELG